MDQSQACQLCISATCDAVSANSMLLETQVLVSNETNNSLKQLTENWTTDPHENGSTSTYTSTSSIPSQFDSIFLSNGQLVNPEQALNNLVAAANASGATAGEYDGAMEAYINTYIAPAAGSGNTTNLQDFSSALVIQIIGALDNPNVWNTGSGFDSPLQMNALTSFLSVVNSDATNDETPLQTNSRNIASSIQQLSGETSTVVQPGTNVNQLNSSTLSILSSQY